MKTAFRLLLYAYVFLFCFETITDFVGIDTPLKPFRLVGYLLALLGGVQILLKYRKFRREDVVDSFLAIIFLWGIILTTILIIPGWTNIYLFANYVTQAIPLYIVYIAMKKIPLDIKEYYRWMNILTVGVLINAAFMNFMYYYIGWYSRLSGFFDNANFAGVTIGVSMVYILHLILKERNILSLVNVLRAGIFAFLFMALLTTGSRAATIMPLFSIFLYLFIFSNMRVRIASSIILGGVLLFYSNKIYNSIYGESDEMKIVAIERISKMGSQDKVEDEDRVIVWQAGLMAGQESLFMGVGISQFQAHFSRWVYKIRSDFHNDSLSLHSTYFEILIEYGFIPFILFMIYVYFLLMKGVRMFYNTRGDYMKKTRSLQLVILITLLTYFLVAAFFLSPVTWFLLAANTKKNYILDESAIS